MAGLLIVPGLWPVFDANGDPVSGATINFYQAGTTTPKAVYSDGTLATSLGTSLTTNAAGEPTTLAGAVARLWWAADAASFDIQVTAGAATRTWSGVFASTYSGNVFVTLEQFGGGISKTGAQNNAAYTAARAASGIICLGSGEYTFASRITLQSNTTILGDSSRTSVMKIANTSDHMILVADGAFYLSAMRGVTCLGVMKATNCRFGFAAFKDNYDIYAEAIEVYDCARTGVLFDCDTASDTAPAVRVNARVRVGSILAERCAQETSGHAGVLLSGTSQVHIDRITVRNHGAVPGNPSAAVGALGDAVVINSGNLSTANASVQTTIGFIEGYDISGGGLLWVNDAREVSIGGGRYSNIWLWPTQLSASAVRITSTGAGLTNNVYIGPMQSLRPTPPASYTNGPHDHLQLGTNVTAVTQAFPQGTVANSRRYDPTNTTGNLTIVDVTAL